MNEYTFNTWVLIWIGIALIAFIASRLVTAPYGRHSSSKWGTTIPNRWAWVLMETPALVLAPLLYFLSGNMNSISTFLVFLWVLHYTHRTLIFPFKIKTSGKRMPLVIVILALIFNGGNGIFNGFWFGNYSHYSSNYFTSFPFIIGLLLFAGGMYLNIRSDYHLINLRKSGEVDYKIPKGGFFDYISCPNHLGEMVEWLGFAIAAGSLPAWSFFIWTAANLIPRSLSHHRWYKNYFTDYPKNRKALIPNFLKK